MNRNVNVQSSTIQLFTTAKTQKWSWCLSKDECEYNVTRTTIGAWLESNKVFIHSKAQRPQNHAQKTSHTAGPWWSETCKTGGLEQLQQQREEGPGGSACWTQSSFMDDTSGTGRNGWLPANHIDCTKCSWIAHSTTVHSMFWFSLQVKEFLGVHRGSEKPTFLKPSKLLLNGGR